MADFLKPVLLKTTDVWPVQRSNVQHYSEFPLHFIVSIFCYHYYVVSDLMPREPSKAVMYGQTVDWQYAVKL